ncbi:MAG: M1 family metallopeptidase [Bacteroidia bacterium]
MTERQRKTIHIPHYQLLVFTCLLLLSGCINQPKPGHPAVLQPDFHSFANYEQNRLKHLDLLLTVDFTTQQLKGNAKWQIERLSLCDTLVLDTRDISIENVLINDNEQAVFHVKEHEAPWGNALYIVLPEHAQSVTISYHTNAGAAALQWLEPQQTLDKTSGFLYTQSQAILARSWIPCQDAPAVRFTYTAKVHVPKGMMAVMSAAHDTVVNQNGVYAFEMDKPIPAYLMALCVGDLHFRSLGSGCGVMAEGGIIESASKEFSDLSKMIASSEKLYGPYRWGRYDVVVLPPSFPFGGMENPCVTFATPTIISGDRSLVSLLAHELAHSWSGNLATNHTWNDFWLNEGFTVYFENRIMEDLYGKAFSKMHEYTGYWELLRTLDEFGPENEMTSLKLNLKGIDPDDAVSDIAYEKGRFFLTHLEKITGREKWDSFLRNYFDSFAFKTITTEQFIETLNNQLLTTAELKKQANVQEWIYGKGLPASFEPPVSEDINNAREAAKKFEKGSSASGLNTKNWHTYQWVQFLRSLPRKLTAIQMNELQKTFFFNSSNSEIRCEWLLLVVHNQYEPAYPVLKKFLIDVGRRKFIKPLYTNMASQPQMKKMAQNIYAEARKGYHTVATTTIDKILNTNK